MGLAAVLLRAGLKSPTLSANVVTEFTPIVKLDCVWAPHGHCLCLSVTAWRWKWNLRDVWRNQRTYTRVKFHRWFECSNGPVAALPIIRESVPAMTVAFTTRLTLARAVMPDNFSVILLDQLLEKIESARIGA